MKVILNKTIESIGEKNQIINVNDGYARNYLIPKKIAIIATENNIKQNKKQQLKIIEKENQKKNEAKILINKIQNKSLFLKAKSGINGKLFGTITTKEISKELKKQFNIDINKKKIELTKNINKLGKYDVKLKIYSNLEATVNIIVQENRG